jgi:hypothetical protein
LVPRYKGSAKRGRYSLHINHVWLNDPETVGYVVLAIGGLNQPHACVEPPLASLLRKQSLHFVFSYVRYQTDSLNVPSYPASMLYELIKANRELLLSRSANLSMETGGHSDSQTASLGHVSIFFDQLTDALRVEYGTPRDSVQTSKRMTSPAPAVQLSESALSHGRELRESNLTIGAVVRNYGSVCQAITGYAVEVNATIDPAEFRTLNWCLDEAMAQAVTAFTTPAPPDAQSLKAAKLTHDARLDGLAKMNYHIEHIAVAIAAMRTGQVGLDGAMGALLDASLKAMRDLVEQGVDQRI